VAKILVPNDNCGDAPHHLDADEFTARYGKSRVTEHWMRLIGFLQAADLIRGELNGDGCDSIILVMGLGRAYDRGSDDWFRKNPL